MQLELPDEQDDTPPDGFRKIAYKSHPERFNGPYYEREIDGRWQIGFRVKERHINHAGLCHGGVVSAFCDMQIRPVKLALGLTRFSPTVNLSVDFVASAQLGDWVQMEPELVRRTTKLMFSTALVKVGDQVVARTSAIYRLLSAGPTGDEPKATPSS
jgi:uncharacterized protein (TIGR00369 family)